MGISKSATGLVSQTTTQIAEASASARNSAKTSVGAWTSDMRSRFPDKTNTRVETIAGVGTSEETGTTVETGASAKTSVETNAGARVESSASASTGEDNSTGADTSDVRGDVKTCNKCYTTKTVVFLIKNKST